MDAPTIDFSNQKVLGILIAVKSVFASKGFDGASMQDLAQGAQMSVGNFYRYFPSKNAIIQAMIQFDMNCLDAEFAEIETAENPREVFLAKLSDRIENLSNEEAALWTEMQAASFRVPEIAAVKRTMERMIRKKFVNALVRIHGGSSPADLERYEQHAQLIMLMVHGFAQRRYGSLKTDQADDKALGQLVFKTLRMAFEASATTTSDEQVLSQ
ncbi:TetR/AcrR family transcriptional regulator [Pseudohoeflea suaedae]|nr:TetR/AcrR family transcriptional regulator [Pseudohoeflea suaedae]